MACSKFWVCVWQGDLLALGVLQVLAVGLKFVLLVLQLGLQLHQVALDLVDVPLQPACTPTLSLCILLPCLHSSLTPPKSFCFSVSPH